MITGIDKIFVISLRERDDRRKSFDINFRDFNYEYVDAVNGKSLDISELVKQGVFSSIFKSPLTGICTKGVFGCALSHLETWKRIKNSKFEKTLILEDDIFLESDIESIETAVSNADDIEDWDVIFLGKQTVNIYSPKDGFENYKSYEKLIDNTPTDLIEMPYGAGFFAAHSYILSQSGVSKLLELTKSGINYPIDVFMEEMKKHGLKIYSTRRSLIRQKSHAVYDTAKKNKQKIDSDTWFNKRKELKSLTLEIDFDLVKKVYIEKSDDNYLKDEPYVHMHLK